MPSIACLSSDARSPSAWPKRKPWGGLSALTNRSVQHSHLFRHVVDRLNELEATKATLARWRTRLEWSSFRQGQGSGYMSSGSDGPLLPACPHCGHLKPGRGAESNFKAEFVGQKADCEFRHKNQKR